MTSLK